MRVCCDVYRNLHTTGDTRTFSNSGICTLWLAAIKALQHIAATSSAAAMLSCGIRTACGSCAKKTRHRACVHTCVSRACRTRVSCHTDACICSQEMRARTRNLNGRQFSRCRRQPSCHTSRLFSLNLVGLSLAKFASVCRRPASQTDAFDPPKPPELLRHDDDGSSAAAHRRP